MGGSGGIGRAVKVSKNQENWLNNIHVGDCGSGGGALAPEGGAGTARASRGGAGGAGRSVEGQPLSYARHIRTYLEVLEGEDDLLTAVAMAETCNHRPQRGAQVPEALPWQFRPHRFLQRPRALPVALALCWTSPEEP